MREDENKQELDTETTFADMNVEGFRWYDPTKKANAKGRKTEREKLTKEEYRSMVKGAFLAYIPMFLSILLGFSIMVLIAYLWMK